MLDCALCYCKMVLYMHLKSSAKHSVCLLAMHITCKDTPIVQLLTGLHGVLNKGNPALRDNIGLQKSLIVASNRKAALICSRNHTRSPFHPYLHCGPWTALSHSECKSWLNIFTCGSTLFPSPQKRKKSHLSTQKGNWSFTLVSSMVENHRIIYWRWKVTVSGTLHFFGFLDWHWRWWYVALFIPCEEMSN